jgi:chromate transport protein ChrA
MTITDRTSTTSMGAPRPFTGATRWPAAAAFLIGGALQLAEFILEPEASDTAKRLEWWGRHPVRMDWSQGVGILAIAFLLVGIAMMWQISRLDSPRTATVAAIVLGTAMIGLGLVHGIELAARWALLAGHGDAARAILDVGDPRLPGTIGFVMFLPAAVLGNLLMMVALWRSRYVPRFAAVLLIAFVVLDFIADQGVVSHAVTLLTGLIVGWAIVARYQRKSTSTAAQAAH